jgi:ribosome assembly protein YihI (activator of Der GTPase)
MATNMDTEPQPAPESLFRPAKRRKFLRRRPDHEQEDNDVNGDSGRDTESSTAQTTQETDDVVRLRRRQRIRKGGIEFSTTGSRQTTDNDAQAVAQRSAEETEDERLRAMCDRFTVHTGQTVDVDKHMYGPFATSHIPYGLLCCRQWGLTR